MKVNQGNICHNVKHIFGILVKKNVFSKKSQFFVYKVKDLIVN